MAPMAYSGAGEKLIPENNPEVENLASGSL